MNFPSIPVPGSILGDLSSTDAIRIPDGSPVPILVMLHKRDPRNLNALSMGFKGGYKKSKIRYRENAAARELPPLPSLRVEA